MKYGELNLGQIEAVVNKLGGMEGVKRFLSGEMVIKKIERKFKIWKTIKLGTSLKTTDDFCRALADGEFKLSDWALDILGKSDFTVAAEESKVDLIKVTIAELGFKNGARCDQIYARAKELGLELCPAEVGPQLRLQYKNQPNGEWILVAMEPITDSGGDLGVFDVGCDDSGLWLDSLWSIPGNVWITDDPWVFFRPRK